MHPWRGNVRELRNAVERALAMAGGGPLEGAEPVAAPTVAISLDQPLIEQRERLVDHFEATYVKPMLEKHQGNFTRAELPTMPSLTGSPLSASDSHAA